MIAVGFAIVASIVDVCMGKKSENHLVWGIFYLCMALAIFWVIDFSGNIATLIVSCFTFVHLLRVSSDYFIKFREDRNKNKKTLTPC